MITRDRTELLHALTLLAERYPNWRFGQLVSNLAGWTDVAFWDVEDEKLLAAAQAHLDHLVECDSQMEV